ncbi:hypothetical protein [Pelomonas sp. Root1444]|uniref:hypothetical protein n=1 Tax=Pelomonas sp. Root1444 TaxID=1736464 RepID=UPI0007028C39|nr:hypothetical protein [Pelomonas sp. Root1444]KQY85965.1 hypothetical protein ASD35_20230 [Pelomonas sp. Root1444]
MNLLVIEDEPGFVKRLQLAFAPDGSSNKLLTPESVGLLKDEMTEGESFEAQFLSRLRNIHERENIDLVLLDTDLSRFKGIPISQTLCRQALQEIGIPVCRYKKSYSSTTSNRLRDLKRIAREGASAVWTPPELVKQEELGDLVPWLLAVEQGFRQIRERLQSDPSILEKPLGPAGVLARVLRAPKLRADLLGYTTQNLFFFAAPINEDDDDSLPPVQVLATRLGYWLFNYVLTFPGPILPTAAAAALFNLDTPSFLNEKVQEIVAPARYSGPFDAVDTYYWREEMNDLLDTSDGDPLGSEQFSALKLKRVDEENPALHAYYCVLSGKPIALAETANPSPDWIPPGADITRISEDLLESLDPMLSM